MEIVFLLAGLCFLAIGAALVVAEARTRRGAVEVAAELVGFSAGRRGASGARFFHAVARYVAPDGEVRYLESSVGSSAPLGRVGDALGVLVQPGDPEKAAIKSSVPYVLGGVLAAMGLGASILFFRTFRITTFSVASALAFVGLGAWKARGALREKPLSLEAWRRTKEKLLGVRVYTESTKGEIDWMEPAALQAATRGQQKASRFAMPFLLLAGGGLVFLGIHLHGRTEAFLERAVGGAGVVVELVANDSSDGTTWAPLVEFEHGGRKYRFKDSLSSSPPSHRRGDAVAVLYDPSRPADARIDRGFWNKGIPVLIGAFGGLLCALGVWMFSRRGS